MNAKRENTAVSFIATTYW